MHTPYSSPHAQAAEHGFGDKTYRPKIYSLRGRIGRLRYMAYLWITALTLNFFLAFIVPNFLPYVIRDYNIYLCKIISLIYVPNLVLVTAVTRRRLHDINRSGWWLLISLIPLAVIPFFLYLLVAPGTEGSNRFGPMAKENSPLIWIPVALFVLSVIGVCTVVSKL